MKKMTKMAAVLAAMSVMVLGAATMVSADEVQGWKQENGSWYFYVDGDKVSNQWALSGKDWYYLGDNGKMVTDEFVGNVHAWDIVEYDVIDAVYEDYYYVDSTGKMATDWVKIEKARTAPYGSDTTNWYYFGADGKMLGDAWVKGATAWYHVDRTGRMQNNLLLVDDNKSYILDKDGAMITGWYKAKADVKDESGTVVVEKDEWAWAKSSGVAKKDGWEKIDGKWYFFGDNDTSNTEVKDFVMAKDMRFKEANRYFRLLDSGAMVTGWYREDRYADWEYYDSKGVQVVDKLEKISGRFYLFDDTGIMKAEGQIAVVDDSIAAASRDYDSYTLTSGGTNAFTDTRKALTSGWVVYELGTTRTGRGLK